ncbi:phosphoribosylglycinamide formyltransferase [Kwoniella heveanensis BCC8398]|uniref:phosphoribosylglycinamide formyltransferase 1 n=1 Tax=Kwoniella heveanensis BCC8398 TaxID=1296120 RepID=A0A1B9GPC0_9TREE|nr:phosphoribosylglycinamide formyltransferase [Kwoniella heveanensis BCC8398]
MPSLQETIVPAPAKRVRRITVLISGSGSNLQALLDAAGTPSLPNAAITHVISSRSAAYGLTRARTANPPIPTSVCALKTFQNKNPGATREDYDSEVARLVLDSKPDLIVLAGWMHILSDRFLRILSGEIEPPSKPALGPPQPASLPTQTEPIPSKPSGSDATTTSSTSATTELDASISKLSIQPNSEQSTSAPQSQSTSEKEPDTSAKLPPAPETLHFPIPIINLHPALPGAFDGANAIGRAFDAFHAGQVEGTGVMVHRVVAEVDRGEPLVVRKVEIKKEDKVEDLEARIHEFSQPP